MRVAPAGVTRMRVAAAVGATPAHTQGNENFLNSLIVFCTCVDN